MPNYILPKGELMKKVGREVEPWFLLPVTYPDVPGSEEHVINSRNYF